MNHKLRLLEQEYLKKNQDENVFKARLNFEVGNTIRVNYRIVEGEKERIQPFEGVVISIKKSGENYNCTFTVRRVNQGYSVERTFPLFSPRVESVTVLKDTYVKRAKLYYLRDRTGKSARLKEKSRRVQRAKKKQIEKK